METFEVVPPLKSRLPALSARTAFLAYVVLLVGRDILAELVLKGTGPTLAFVNVATIGGMGLMILLLRGGFGTFLRKVRRPAVLWRSLLCGISAAPED